jgi:hypothetical protein
MATMSGGQDYSHAGRAKKTASAQQGRVPSVSDLAAINAARKAMGAGVLNVAKHRSASVNVKKRLDERGKGVKGSKTRKPESQTQTPRAPRRPSGVSACGGGGWGYSARP